MINANDIALNEDFLALEKHLSKFNIFHATDMGKREIKHTKFLAYLLNPRGAHGLGDRFLIEFIRNAFRQSENCNFLDLRFSEAEINCEVNLGKNFGRIDILLSIPTKSERTCIIAIENKLEAQQGNEQLIKYQDGITEKYQANKNYITHFFYLTQNPEEADEPWVSVLHEDVTIPAIKSLLDNSNKETLSNYIQSILIDYTELLRTNKDSETAELLASKMPEEYLSFLNIKENKDNIQPLYLLYPNAVDFLKQYKGKVDPRIELLGWFKNLTIEGVEIVNSNINYFRCISLDKNTKEYLKSITNNATSKWIDNGLNIALEFVVSSSKNGRDDKFSIYSKIVFGPTNEDFRDRKELIKNLREKLDSNKGFRSQSNRFSLIYRDRQKYFNGDNAAAQEFMSDYIKSYKKEIAPKLNEAIVEFISKLGIKLV